MKQTQSRGDAGDRGSVTERTWALGRAVGDGEGDDVEAERRPRLVEGAVGPTLVRLTLPMILGIISMVGFNLVDTFFVGRLGTLELAALSFTFPVILLVTSLSMGLGIGASAVISRAIGEGNHRKVQRLATDGLLLSLLLVAALAIPGFFTVGPIFRLIGAAPEILPLVKQYMRIWYAGVIFVTVPMVGNNAIRAAGDTKTPSIIMILGALFNAVLDPLLIFGIGPFPRLEIAGAALATVIARAITLVAALFFLWKRERMITLKPVSWRNVLVSWRQILYIGLPTAATRVIVPLGTGVIISLVATYGPESVAAFGVASRVGFFCMAAVAALSSVLGPFIGQNWGAGRYDRVRAGLRLSQRFSIGWGAGVFLLLVVMSRSVASVFSKDPMVVSVTAAYLSIVPLGFGLRGVLMVSAMALTVLRRPLLASGFALVQMFMLCVPMAYAGSHLLGLPGIFAAFVLSDAICGVWARTALGRVVVNEEKLASGGSGC